jgi:electron transport complex protein RnfG
LASGAQAWAVKKDGGQFIYRTGATITPRAVVKALHQALQFYQQHQAELFSLPNQQAL